MRIIDAHVNLLEYSNSLEHLIRVMDENGIEKSCIMGLGKIFGCLDNVDVKKALELYPDRLIGAYFLRPGLPGENDPLDIRKAYERGFKMIKVTLSKKPYDDPSYFPLWETAQELRMPVLFHTGVVTTKLTVPEERISSWFMHPARLESIANVFPDLYIIIAHLGVHWNSDAAEVIRMRKNVYADITGEPDGWRVRADKVGLDKWLWWSGAFKKLIFGTDVSYENIPLILKQDKERFTRLEIDQETQKLFFAGNICKLLGLDP